MIQTAIFYFSFFWLFIFTFLWFGLLSIFIKNQPVFFQKQLAFISRLLLLFCRIKVKVEGLENIPRNTALFLTANHSSFLDTFILMASINRPLRFTVYPLGFKMPLLRLIYGCAGFVPVGETNNDLASFQQIRSAINNKEIIVVYHKSDKEISPALISLSHNTLTPILTVQLINVDKLLPFNRLTLGPALIMVKAGLPRFF